jgi:hypothetical protein
MKVNMFRARHKYLIGVGAGFVAKPYSGQKWSTTTTHDID